MNMEEIVTAIKHIKAIEASALVGPICDEVIEALKRYTDGEKTEGLIGEILQDELLWADKTYKGDTMNCWINGYRNALNTVLQKVNTHHSEKEAEAKDRGKVKKGNEHI